MVDPEGLERVLSDTRAHFRAPLAARTRVRAALVARGDVPAQAGGALRSIRTKPGPLGGGVAKSTAALLAGLTFAVGFWLGGQRARHAAEPRESVGAAVAQSLPPAAPELAAARELSAPAEPAVVEPVRDGASQAQPGGSPQERDLARTSAARREARAQRRRPESAATGSEELALLQRAERALRAGTPELALSFLDDLDRHYPQTRFVEERTAARLMARCLRSEPGARAQAELFLRDRSTSVYSDRVRELCRLPSTSAARDGSREVGH